MAEESARLRIPYIAAAQAQKHVTHNEAMTLLDTLVQLSVIDKDLTVPPGSPEEGDTYIVGGSATGAWLGWDDRVARFIDGEWRSYLPGAGDGAGWLAWVIDEDALYVFDGDDWVTAGVQFGPSIDLAEISPPSSPGGNIARLYAKDDGGTTKLAFKDAAGTETVLGAGGGGLADTSVQATRNGASGLVVKYVTAATLDVDADRLVLYDGSGNGKVFNAVNLTANIGSSGANGLDTGSEASSTWYYIWVIGQAGGTVAALLSVSTTSPTLPGGYTFKGRVGAVRNDGSSNFATFLQRGRLVNANMGVALSAGTATSDTAVDLSAFVPADATRVHFLGSINASSGSAQVSLLVAPATAYGFGALTRNDVGSTLDLSNTVSCMIETPQQVVYRVTGANARGGIFVTGWEF